MDSIPGIDSILRKSATFTWRGETTPAPELVSLIDAIPQKINAGKFRASAIMLNQLAHNGRQPSQRMRLHYLRGRLAAAQEDWHRAFDSFTEALDVATDVADYDSMIELTREAANTLHNLLRYDDALEYYRIAHTTWQEKVKDLYKPHVEPDVVLITAIGRQQWLIGSHEDAHTTIARALGLAMRDTGVPISNEMRKATADALWMLSLVLRAQSDMNDGDEGYLQQAREHMQQALGLFEAVSAPDHAVGRLHVQLAEIYLDIAEIYLLDNAVDAARAIRARGLRRVQTAADYLEPTSDETGKMLAHITRCRADILWLRPQSSALEAKHIHDTLTVIEYKAGQGTDRALMAKAATLRAEWYIALGNAERARHWLRWALRGYRQGSAMGMATRVHRLLRHLNHEPLRPDPSQRSSYGPLPDPLIPPDEGLGLN